MKISVVMATYNGEKYLKEQLDSLRTQTLQADEVIICDDCSKDSTQALVKEYIDNNHLDDKWKLVINEKNLGYAGNFIKALQMAQGEYIFFSDQDDIWDKNKQEEIVRVMEKHQEIQLLCSDYTPFSCSSQAPVLSHRIKKSLKYDNSIEKVELNLKNIYIASIGCVMTIRKSFRDRIMPFWINGWAHDDFVWKTAQCVNGCYLFHKSLIRRRLHDSNVSMRKKHDKNVRIQFLKELTEANKAMLTFAGTIPVDSKKMHMIERTVTACRLRTELVEKKKLVNSIKLLRYIDCYQSKKSIIMELCIALRK